jgi:hypothetical protein
MAVDLSAAAQEVGRRGFNLLGIDFTKSIDFLKFKCRLDVGFEAQLVGLKVHSATSSAIIGYVLALLGQLTPTEREKVIEDILYFARNKQDRSIQFGTSHPSSWSTSQAALALSVLGGSDQTVRQTLEGLLEFQLPTGEWTFSCREDAGIIYAVYPTLALLAASGSFECDFSEQLNITREWLESEAPETETEKLIRANLLFRIELHFGLHPTATLMGSVDFGKLVSTEYGRFVVNEYTSSPFSMSLFGPALYLLARPLISADHPFALYCLKNLSDSVSAGKDSWPLLAKKKTALACSFCTALAVLTVHFWLKDVARQDLCLDSTIPVALPVSHIKAMLTNLGKNPVVFISYSSRDSAVAALIADKLKQLGYEVIFAEYDLLVGDSVPGFISDALERMDFFVACLSDDAIKSRYVRDELDGAKASEWRKKSKVILPAMIRSCEVPGIIAAKKWADFTLSFDKGMADLLRAMTKSSR